MANTPEGNIKKRIKEVCDKHGAYYHMPVQNGMGKPTLDFVICLNGRFIGVEAKAPGKKATPRQLLTMEEMLSAGGYTLVVDGEETLTRLELLLDMIKQQEIPEAYSYLPYRPENAEPTL